MNIYIIVDMEGISGIMSREQVSITEPGRYNEGRMLMVKDINACVEACHEAGADKIIVRDAHGSGNNVIWSELSPLADWYVMGNTGQIRFPGLDECDAVILLGYHAMAGTPGGILEHSFNSKRIQNLWINNIKAGEIAVDAAAVGEYDKPVILVTGDDKACKEAKTILPWVITAEVKRGITWSGGMLLPPEKAYELIKEKTREAISKFSEMKPLIFEKPIRLRVEQVERCMVPNKDIYPYIKVIDGRTYEVEADTVEEALFRRLGL